MEKYFMIAEFILFLVFLPIVYNAFQAIDLSKLFKRGYTSQIRTVLIMIIIVLAYFLSHAITSVLELFFNIVN
mgnify:CR=1 FL=1